MVARLSHLQPVGVAARRADELLEEFRFVQCRRPGTQDLFGRHEHAPWSSPPHWWRIHPSYFLDEPTTGLDPQSRQALWVSIEDLVRQGTTVLLTTQYLEEADRLAHDIVVIDHGRVIAQGSPAQLKADLGTSVVSVTLGEDASLARAVELLSPCSEKPPLVENLIVELTVNDGPNSRRRRPAHTERRRRYRSPAWPSASRAWTTCSSP